MIERVYSLSFYSSLGAPVMLDTMRMLHTQSNGRPWWVPRLTPKSRDWSSAGAKTDSREPRNFRTLASRLQRHITLPA